MFDPEMTLEPLLVEVSDTVKNMRKADQIEDKLKYSQHLLNVSKSFGNLMSTMQLMMSEEMMESLEYDEFEEDIEF